MIGNTCAKLRKHIQARVLYSQGMSNGMFYIVHLDLNLKQVVWALRFKCCLVDPCNLTPLENMSWRHHIMYMDLRILDSMQHRTKICVLAGHASASTFGHTDK